MKVLFTFATLLLSLFLPVAVVAADVPSKGGNELDNHNAEQYSDTVRALQAMDTSKMTIAEIAASDTNFKTLVAALDAAGLVDTLDGEGTFTVFAPTNDAFAALGAGTVDKLLLPGQKETLTSILLFHVYLEAAVLSGDLSDRQRITMANDSKIKVRVKERRRKGTVISVRPTQGGRARVGPADIVAKNGVIHVIDKVLIPRKTAL